MYININGRVVEEKEAVISPYDHGYLYGVGVFETFRTYNGHPFLFTDHFNRLCESLQALQIPLPYTEGELLQEVRRTIEANDMEDAYVRLNISAGTGEIGLQTDPYLTPTIIIFVKPIAQPTRKEKHGMILKLRRNSPEGPMRLKSHHYLNNILAKREIGNDPSVEGIFLSHDGFLAEGIVSNLFWVKDGEIYTPSLSTGILNGITRQYMVNAAKNLGFSITEGNFVAQNLFDADEVFVTNSIQEIVPLHHVEHVEYPGVKGSITKRLILQYEHHRASLFSRTEC